VKLREKRRGKRLERMMGEYLVFFFASRWGHTLVRSVTGVLVWALPFWFGKQLERMMGQ
jgi:hypothetical protein